MSNICLRLKYPKLQSNPPSFSYHHPYLETLHTKSASSADIQEVVEEQKGPSQKGSALCHINVSSKYSALQIAILLSSKMA